MGKPLIELRNISFAYDPARPVLQNLDFTLQAGERVALIGSNGSGKSTLLAMIVGLLFPQRGTVVVFGKTRRQEADFLAVRQRIGLLFQSAEDQLFCPTVEEDVAFGPFNQGKNREQVAEAVAYTLERLQISHLRTRVTHKLSGGEKRLVSLATVLAMEPEILLLDEPAYGLDESSAQRMLEILAELTVPMIIIAHHHDFLSRIACRGVSLRQGRLDAATVGTGGSFLRGDV